MGSTTPPRGGPIRLRAEPNARRGRRVLAALVALTSGVAFAGADPAARGAAEPVLAAVGDIARCRGESDDATAAVAAQVPGTIAALGDLVEGKAAGEYEDCFDPSWGPLRSRIRPTPGDNGEYGDRGFPQLDDYRAYFGEAAVNEDGDTWYSYDYGSWHVIALDSSCVDEPDGCRVGSAQVEWLKADLAAHPARCTLVYSHHPFVDRPGHGTRGSLRPILDVLYEAGTDVWLSGHRHTYRRYAPVDVDGERDDEAGIRQFIVGTGGHSLNSGGAGFEAPHGVLEATHGDTWGVLRLTLRPGGYQWEFVPADAPGSGDATDSGSATCHGDGPLPATTTTSSPAGSPPRGPAPPPPSSPPPDTPAGGSSSGYWMVGADGSVHPFGAAVHHGSGGLTAPAVDLEATPSGQGYWVVDSAGAVAAHGDAGHHGGLGPAQLAAGETVTSVSATPSAAGYWIFTDRGRAFPFGDAAHFGDLAGVALNGPVLDSVPSASGRGYYMVAADGGIFTFGDARFHGSMGATPLNRPVVGMVAYGDGYLMVAADGGIFNFSDRPFHSSLGHHPPPHPIVAVASLP